MLDARTATRLSHLLGMLGSAHDGEALNAARKADALVRGAGLTWSDIVHDRPEVAVSDVGTMTAWLLEHRAHLDEAERLFIQTVAGYRMPPTDRQLDWLCAIYERVQGKAA